MGDTEPSPPVHSIRKRNILLSLLIAFLALLLLIGSVIVAIKVIGILSTRRIYNNEVYLIGDAHEFASGVRGELDVDDEYFWGNPDLRVTHLGGGYDLGPGSVYDLRELAERSNNHANIVYRLGVNDVESLDTESMWLASMMNAHINILGSKTVPVEYQLKGQSTADRESQTVATVSPDSTCEFPVEEGKWYCILAGYRAEDSPNFNLKLSSSISDSRGRGSNPDRYFRPNALGMDSAMTPASEILRFPIYHLAEETGIVELSVGTEPIAEAAVNETAIPAGVWYIGETFELSEKKKSTVVFVADTNLNRVVGYSLLDSEDGVDDSGNDTVSADMRYDRRNVNVARDGGDDGDESDSDDNEGGRYYRYRRFWRFLRHLHDHFHDHHDCDHNCDCCDNNCNNNNCSNTDPPVVNNTTVVNNNISNYNNTYNSNYYIDDDEYYYDYLSGVYTLLKNSIVLPWINFQVADVIPWGAETNQYGDNYYTNTKLLGMNVRRILELN